MRDMVQLHITSGVPIRAQALRFAGRVEVRLGKAFPVALIVDRDALAPLIDALTAGRDELRTTSHNTDNQDREGRGK